MTGKSLSFLTVIFAVEQLHTSLEKNVALISYVLMRIYNCSLADFDELEGTPGFLSLDPGLFLIDVRIVFLEVRQSSKLVFI